MAIVKHLKFGSTTYDLPEGKSVLNLLCDNAQGADVGSFNLWVDVYEDQGQPMYTAQYGVYGYATKTKITTASNYGQNEDFEMNIEAVVNGIPCILVKYSEFASTWSYRGSGHRFAYDINGGKLYEFDFELDLSIDLTSGNYTGNLSQGDFYSISNINEVSIGGSSSAGPGNWKVATVYMQNGQIQSVVSTPQAGCADLGGMNLGVSVGDQYGQLEAYLHSLGHNFINSSAPGVKWDTLGSMDGAGALQPNDNITLNLYFMSSANAMQKVSISGIYDSQLSWGGYLYFLDSSTANITQVQYVGQ